MLSFCSIPNLGGMLGFEFRAVMCMAFVASTDEPYRGWGSGAIGHRLTVPVRDKIRSRGNRVSVGLEL